MDDGLKLTKVINSELFYEELEALVKNHKLDYIDAIVHMCDKNQIEIEVAASLIKSNSRIKSVVQAEGETLNILPRRARLPI